jgi:hypothetical protein
MTTRAQHILTLFNEAYEGPPKFRHRVAGATIGLAGLGAAALAGHAMAKGQSFGQSVHDLGHHFSNAWNVAQAHASPPGGSQGMTTVPSPSPPSHPSQQTFVPYPHVKPEPPAGLFHPHRDYSITKRIV